MLQSMNTSNKRPLEQSSGDDDDPKPIPTNDDKPPCYWEIESSPPGTYKKYNTNVVNMTWNPKSRTWYVQNYPTPKGFSVPKHKTMQAAFDAACAFRQTRYKERQPIKQGEVVLDPATNTWVVSLCTERSCVQKTNIAIAEFAPDPAGNGKASLNQLESAVAVLTNPEATPAARCEALETIKQVVKKTKTCYTCRQKSAARCERKREKCMSVIKAIRNDLAQRTCHTCGLQSQSMQCDHVTGKKFGDICDITDWTKKTMGPDALWREYKDKTVPRCSFCHSLELTHSKYGGADSTQMATDTATEIGHKRHREYNEEKTKINNGWKHAVGSCFYCKRPIKEGEEHAFVWMHSQKKMVADRVANGLPPLEKLYTISTMKKSSICPETFKLRAWPEINDKCELGCSNCHHIVDTLPERAAQTGRLQWFVERMRLQGGVRDVGEWR